MVAVAEPRGTRLFTGRRQNSTGDLKPPVFLTARDRRQRPILIKKIAKGETSQGAEGGWVSPTQKAPGTGGARLHTLSAKSIYHFDVRKNDILHDARRVAPPTRKNNICAMRKCWLFFGVVGCPRRAYQPRTNSAQERHVA